MRKFNHLLLVLSAFSFVIISCVKEGPEGPPGPTGPQGPGGTGGTPGTANVIYSNWFSFAAAAWGDTTLYGLDYKRAIRTVTSLTQVILDNGTVLTYMKPGTTTSVYLLPINLYYTNPQSYENHGTIIAVGKLIYTFQNVSNGVVGNFAPTSNQYRYILIPGGVLGGRLTNGESTYYGYTTQQLQNMSYEQVLEIFKVPANGTNIN